MFRLFIQSILIFNFVAIIVLNTSGCAANPLLHVVPTATVATVISNTVKINAETSQETSKFDPSNGTTVIPIEINPSLEQSNRKSTEIESNTAKPEIEIQTTPEINLESENTTNMDTAHTSNHSNPTENLNTKTELSENFDEFSTITNDVVDEMANENFAETEISTEDSSTATCVTESLSALDLRDFSSDKIENSTSKIFITATTTTTTTTTIAPNIEPIESQRSESKNLETKESGEETETESSEYEDNLLPSDIVIDNQTDDSSSISDSTQTDSVEDKTFEITTSSSAAEVATTSDTPDALIEMPKTTTTTANHIAEKLFITSTTASSSSSSSTSSSKTTSDNDKNEFLSADETTITQTEPNKIEPIIETQAEIMEMDKKSNDYDNDNDDRMTTSTNSPITTTETAAVSRQVRTFDESSPSIMNDNGLNDNKSFAPNLHTENSSLSSSSSSLPLLMLSLLIIAIFSCFPYCWSGCIATR